MFCIGYRKQLLAPPPRPAALFSGVSGGPTSVTQGELFLGVASRPLLRVAPLAPVHSFSLVAALSLFVLTPELLPPFQSWLDLPESYLSTSGSSCSAVSLSMLLGGVTARPGYTAPQR